MGEHLRSVNTSNGDVEETVVIQDKATGERNAFVTCILSPRLDHNRLADTPAVVQPAVGAALCKSMSAASH